MIVLHVVYRCKPEMREEFLENILAEGIDVASRAEDGNLQYDYFFPADNENDLLLIEKWRDAGALAEHGAQPHFVRLKEIKTEYVTDTVIERFHD